MNCLYCSLSTRTTAGGTGLGVSTAVAICGGCGAGLCRDHLVAGATIRCSSCAPNTPEKGSAHAA